MKTYLFTAALFLGSAAVAQTGGQSGASQPGSTQSGTSDSGMSQTQNSPTDQMGQTGQQPDAGSPPGQTTSGIADRDAIDAAGSMAGPVTSDYPPCSRTVVDRCIETGRRRGPGRGTLS